MGAFSTVEQRKFDNRYPGQGEIYRIISCRGFPVENGGEEFQRIWVSIFQFKEN